MEPVSTLAADVGQLLWVGFEGHRLPDELAGRIRAGQVGATILFARNIEGAEQVTALVDTLHTLGPERLLVSVDQEGGRVARLRRWASEWPPMLRVGSHGEDACEAVGRAIGRELRALGFDLDFAPVLDVHTNPMNPVIGDRAFASQPGDVVRLAGAFARGLRGEGVIACGKHFPGHGDTHLDSHLALPRVDHPLERLRAVELAPFAALGEVDTIMTAHVIFSALDAEHPATLSAKILTEVLRGELGYQGVIVSDDLEMKAIADHYGLEDAVVRGLRAGCDAFLLCHQAELQVRAFAALVKAGEKDSEVRARLGESAARVRELKARHKARLAELPAIHPSVVGCAEHRALAERLI
jgi:beta-N-acetylhexosaminidase